MARRRSLQRLCLFAALLVGCSGALGEDEEAGVGPARDGGSDRIDAGPIRDAGREGIDGRASTGDDAARPAIVDGSTDASRPPAPRGRPTWVRTLVAEDQAPWGKNLIDVDADGDLDVAIAGGRVIGSSVYWYRYPDFSRFTIGGNGGDDDLQVGDVNGDGASDVVVNGGVTWYENPRGSGGDVTGAWPEHVVDAGNNAHDLVLGHVDGDGRLDIVTRGEFGPTRLYLQSRAGTFSSVPLGNAPDGEGTALADIDRDGRVDVVGNGYWLRQPADPSDGGAWMRHEIGAWPAGSCAQAADINADGRVDVVLSASEVGVGYLSWFAAPADPLSGAWTRYDIDMVEDVHRFHVGDVDRDGFLDVVFAEMHQSRWHRLGVYYGDGGGAWTLDTIDDGGGHNIAIGDVDADGDVDILSANWNTEAPDGGDVVLFLSEPGAARLGAFAYVEIDGARSRQSFGVAFGDLNRDGRRDVVAGNAWYRNPGGDLAAAWSRTVFPWDVDAMVAVDVDSDGQLDLIAEGPPSSGTVPVYWLEPTDDAATVWSRVQIGDIPADAADGTSQGYALGEIAGGGSPEIVLSSRGLYYFRIPTDPRAGSWPRVEITPDAREEGIALGDLDRDGDWDAVAVVAPGGTSVAWWENPGTGASGWARHPIGTTSGPEADRVAIADFDADGRLDVVITETNLGTSGNSLLWFAAPPDPSGTAWERRTIASDQATLNSMDVADFTGDGLSDVVTGEHRGSLAVTIWENARTSWAAHRISEGRESHLGTRTSDLDGDGDSDIVSTAWDAYQSLHLWRNDAP